MGSCQMLIQLIGGLGLFLYGMKLMGDGLENATGDKLKSILEKVTGNKFIGVLVGATVTAIIQSSSATTVMVVSFVNAGIMSLVQAVGVIMGANIGTTITAQMVSLDLDAIAPLFAGVGAIAMLVCSKKKIKDIFSIILGFGILFMGMNLMSSSMEPLRESQLFMDIIIVIGDNKLLGVFTGLIMTAIIQSSSATTGILVALATTGSINIEAALPIILGCNIGTCVTALLASVGANRTAKKASLIHLFFNIIGVIIFLPFMDLLIDLIQKISPLDVKRQVANAHTIFNVAITIILLPLSNYLVLLVNKIMPGDDEIEKEGAIYLDKNLLDTPVVAVNQVFKETIRMGTLAKNNLELSMRTFLYDEENFIDEVYKNEKTINILEKEITDYLVCLSSYDIPEHDSKILSATYHVINDFERIGDHAENIIELASEKINGKVVIANDAKDELLLMYSETLNAVKIALDSYSKKDVNIAIKIKDIEEKIDNYEATLRENNITRLNERKCNANASTIFLDLVSNLERIGDHANNIAQAVV